MPTNHQPEIEMKKGELHINGEKYEPVVTAPKAHDILLAQDVEKASVQEVYIQEGGSK